MWCRGLAQSFPLNMIPIFVRTTRIQPHERFFSPRKIEMILERGVCASDGRWIRWKHEFDTPLTNQYLKGLQCWIGLRWRRLCLSRGEVIWHHAFSFPF